MAGLRSRPQTVVATDGRIWTVRRVLLPRPPRWVGREKPGWARAPTHRDERTSDRDAWLDAFDGLVGVGDFGDTPIGGLVALLIAIALVAVLAVFAWYVLFPALFFLGDLLVLLLIAAVGVATRILFRRPWKIEAITPGPPAEEYRVGVVGVRASAATVESLARRSVEVARRVRSGRGRAANRFSGERVRRARRSRRAGRYGMRQRRAGRTTDATAEWHTGTAARPVPNRQRPSRRR